MDTSKILGLVCARYAEKVGEMMNRFRMYIPSKAVMESSDGPPVENWMERKEMLERNGWEPDNSGVLDAYRKGTRRYCAHDLQRISDSEFLNILDAGEKK